MKNREIVSNKRTKNSQVLKPKRGKRNVSWLGDAGECLVGRYDGQGVLPRGWVQREHGVPDSRPFFMPLTRFRMLKGRASIAASSGFSASTLWASRMPSSGEIGRALRVVAAGEFVDVRGGCARSGGDGSEIDFQGARGSGLTALLRAPHALPPAVGQSAERFGVVCWVRIAAPH